MRYQKYTFIYYVRYVTIDFEDEVFIRNTKTNVSRAGFLWFCRCLCLIVCFPLYYSELGKDWFLLILTELIKVPYSLKFWVVIGRFQKTVLSIQLMKIRNDVIKAYDSTAQLSACTDSWMEICFKPLNKKSQWCVYWNSLLEVFCRTKVLTNFAQFTKKLNNGVLFYNFTK